MRGRCRPLVVVILACVLFGACGDDDTPAAGDTAAGGAATTIGTNIDCPKLKETLDALSINWRVLIGLASVPTTEWATVSADGLADFPAQLAVAGAALGKNLQAAGALKYMAEAYDIVKRGLDGDSATQADLESYLGPDDTVSINKQIPIALAYTQAGCS